MKRRLLSAFAFLALSPLPIPLIAQEPVRGDVPGAGSERIMQFVMSRRARLGLKVNLRARETDSVGAYVDAVTPNGPAAKAGIRSGDVITKVDQKSVLNGGETISRDGRESLPGLRLIELAATLEPNDTVAVEYRRGKDRKTVSVVTSDEPNILFRGRPDAGSFAFRYGPGNAVTRGMSEDEIFTSAPFLYGSPLADLELAPLNPDLGQYFGTATGVLVISAPAESALGFKGGDVVMSVDGRKPESPSHLLRILRSYGDGESYQAEVLRNRKRVTVGGKLGAGS
jgi:S1-C subfamily serine protease